MCRRPRTHTHTERHTCWAPSPGSYHYPSLHPPFGISRPDRSWPITLSHSRPAYLSLSHPLSYLTFSISLLFTPYLLSLSRPPHTTLSCLQTVSVSKLLKSSAHPILLLLFSFALFKVSLHLPSTTSRHLTLTNLLLAPL